jgi:hypothetical protein
MITAASLMIRVQVQVRVTLVTPAVTGITLQAKNLKWCNNIAEM